MVERIPKDRAILRRSLKEKSLSTDAGSKDSNNFSDRPTKEKPLSERSATEKVFPERTNNEAAFADSESVFLEKISKSKVFVERGSFKRFKRDGGQEKGEWSSRRHTINGLVKEGGREKRRLHRISSAGSRPRNRAVNGFDQRRSSLQVLLVSALFRLYV